MKQWWPIGAMVLGMLLAIASVFLMREAKKQEAAEEGAAADPTRSWNLPTGTLPGADDAGDGGAPPAVPPSASAPLQQQARNTLNLLQQMNDALAGKQDPRNQPPMVRPPGGGAPEPVPFSVDKRLAYGFFILSPTAAAQAMHDANPKGKRGPKHIGRMLILNLSKPGASTSEVIRVKGVTDPGPGVGALLAALGLPGALPPLFGDPMVLNADEAKQRLELLEKGLEEVGGVKPFGMRAALWRVKVLQPELETSIGTVPPPGEPLLPHQKETAKRARSEVDTQLIRSYLNALKATVEASSDPEAGEKVLFLVKAVA